MGLLNKTKRDEEPGTGGGSILPDVHLVHDPLDARLKSDNEFSGGVHVEHRGNTGVDMRHSGSTGFELKGTTHVHHQGTAGVELQGTAHVHHRGTAGVEMKGGMHMHHAGEASLDLGGGAEIQLGTGDRPLRGAFEIALGGAPLRLGPITLDLGKLSVAPDLELTVRLFGKYTLLSIGLRGRTRVARDDD